MMIVILENILICSGCVWGVGGIIKKEREWGKDKITLMCMAQEGI